MWRDHAIAYRPLTPYPAPAPLQAQLNRIMTAKFDFNDFLKQWQNMNNMGGTAMMKLLPGFNKVK